MNVIKSSHGWIVLITILISGGLTIYGLLQQTWPNVLPIRSWSAIYYFIFIVGSTLLVTLIARITHRRVLAIIILLAFVITIWECEIWSLLIVILYALASLSLGYLALNLLRISEQLVNDANKLLLGAGIFASLVGLSVHLPINYAEVYFSALITPIFFARVWLYRRIKYMALTLYQPTPLIVTQDWPKIALGVLCLLYFCFAFLPELGFDALVTHLFVPAHVAIRHEWGFNPLLYVWAFMPMVGDWNFTVGYMLAGEVGARLINIGFIYILTYLVRELVLWLGGDEKSTILAMLLFLATPLTFTESSSLFIESIWASYLVAGLIWILKSTFEREHRGSGIMLAGSMLGLAAATKSITLIYFPALLLPILFYSRVFFSKPLWSSTVNGIFFFIVMGIIPYGAAYWVTGNPVFPFYNAYFNSPFYPPENFNNTLFNSTANWDLPYQIVFNSSKYIEGTVGASGFQWIMLLLPTCALIFLFNSKRSMALIGISTLSLILLFHFQSYLRYAFPVLVFLCALIGVSITLSNRINAFIRISMLIMVSLTLGFNLIFLGSGVWPYRDIPVMEAFNVNNREQWMLARAPIRKAVEAVNIMNDNRSPVVFLSLPFGADLSADALYDWWYNPTFGGEIQKIDAPQSFANLLNKYHVKYIILDSNWSTKTQKDIMRKDAVENATSLVENFGTISVRVLKNN